MAGTQVTAKKAGPTQYRKAVTPNLSVVGLGTRLHIEVTALIDDCFHSSMTLVPLALGRELAEVILEVVAMVEAEAVTMGVEQPVATEAE